MGTADQRPRRNGCRGIWAYLSLAGALSVLQPAAAMAEGVINFGEDQSISIGMGVRTSVDFQEYGAPDKKSTSTDFQLDSLRLYINASLNQYIKATFNTETNSATGTVTLLDGIARFELSDGFNIWAGRMLPPSDRANLDGPYYLNTWNYPGVVSQYPSIFEGRDDGVDVWGKLFNKHLVYVFGVFQGHNDVAGASNQGDNPLVAGRVTYNFLDPEPDPAYYLSSTYYGKVDVLSVGFAFQYEKDGVGTALDHGDYLGYNFDVLFEKRLGGGSYKDGPSGGVITLEGAYYHYDTGGKFDYVPPSNYSYATCVGAAPGCNNVGGIQEGTGYLAGAAYLIPGKVGWGEFQPAFRFQQFHNDLTNVTTQAYDAGVNYIISGHNARISADYTLTEETAKADVSTFVLGVQLQF